MHFTLTKLLTFPIAPSRVLAGTFLFFLGCTSRNADGVQASKSNPQAEAMAREVSSQAKVACEPFDGRGPNDPTSGPHALLPICRAASQRPCGNRAGSEEFLSTECKKAVSDNQTHVQAVHKALTAEPNDGPGIVLLFRASRDEVSLSRRNRLLAETVTCEDPRPPEGAQKCVERATSNAQTISANCNLSSLEVDRLFMASALHASSAREALDRCFDLARMQTGRLAVGNVTDLLLAGTALREALPVCHTILAKAPEEDARELIAKIALLRGQVARFDDILRRDRADVFLRDFGGFRDERPLACPWAEALVTKSKTRDAQAAANAFRLWQDLASQGTESTASYSRIYEQILAGLDALATSWRTNWSTMTSASSAPPGPPRARGKTTLPPANQGIDDALR
jgi:hypothetical protein